MSNRFSGFDPFDYPIHRQLREIEANRQRLEDTINPPGLRALTAQVDRAQSIASELTRHEPVFDEINRTRTLADEVEKMQRLVDPLSDAMRVAGVHDEIGLAGVQNVIDQRGGSIAGAIAALEQPKDINAAIGALGARMDPLSAAARIADTFRRPEISELASIADAGMSASRIAGEIFGTGNRLEDALARIESPWADIAATPRSAGAIADINAIGGLFGARDPFSSDVLANLRPSLGDWRDTIIPDPLKLATGAARREFYVAQGYDAALGNFTEEAFKEVFDDAGLWDAFEDAADDDPVADVAYRMLRKFERELRDFIDRTLTREFGEDWVRLLPSNMRENWEDKKKRKLKAGRPVPSLIICADFADYPMIIENRTFWPAFKKTFRVKSGVQEAFGRLAPVRIATMHAEDLTLDDATIVLTEAAFIRRAIRAH